MYAYSMFLTFIIVYLNKFSTGALNNFSAAGRYLQNCNSIGRVTVCDINKEMLRVGEDRANKAGLGGKIEWVEGNAEQLPFPEESFSAYTIAFGIRNVTRIHEALLEAYRVLCPGGRFLCLEFSHVDNPILKKMYDEYSFQVISF